MRIKKIKTVTNSDTGYRTAGKWFAAVIFCFLFSVSLFSFNLDYRQSQAGSGYPGEYLYNFSANIRNMALGKAGTADSDPASGSYWNPALLFPGRAQVYLFYSNSFYNTKFNYIGSSFGLNKLFSSEKKLGAIGFSFIGLESGDFEKTNVLGESQGSFSIIDRAYKLSYGSILLKNIKFGLGLNYIEQTVDLVSGSVFGLDLGFGYDLKERLFFGLNFQNINAPEMKLKTAVDRYPLNVKTGLLLSPFKKDYLRIVFDYDLVNLFGPGGLSNKWHSGLEIRPSKYFDLRMGMDYKEISAGLGIRYNMLRLDYAFTSHELGQNHRVGILLDFDLEDKEESVKKKLERRKKEEEKLEAEMDLKATEEKRKKEEELRQQKEQEERVKAERMNNLNALLDSGRKSLDQKNYAEAKAEFEKVLSLDPANAQAKQLLDNAGFLLKAEKKKKDYAALDSAVLSDNQPEIQELLSRIKSEYPEILDEFRKAKYDAAIRLTEDQDYGQALSFIGQILKVDPQNSPALELKKKVEELKKLLE